MIQILDFFPYKNLLKSKNSNKLVWLCISLFHAREDGHPLDSCFRRNDEQRGLHLLPKV